jgi:hypothetical protein
MTLDSFKNLAEAIYAVVSTLAIIIGGSWAYWKFVIQKERAPRAEFDLTAEFIGRQDGKWLLEVSGRLVNKGKVRHQMENATLNIRYLLPTDPVVESEKESQSRQVSFPHSIGRRSIWWDSYIDPGLEFRNSYLTWVPEEATYILLLCKFRYIKGRYWPAQRVLRVPTSTEVDDRPKETRKAE